MKNLIRSLGLMLLISAGFLNNLHAQCTPLPAPANLKVTQITGTTANANWNVVYGANYYQIVLTNLYTNTVEQQYAQSANSKSLTGMSPNTRYRVDVSASQCLNFFNGAVSSKEFTTESIIVDNIVWFNPNSPNQGFPLQHLNPVTAVFDASNVAYICLPKYNVAQFDKAFHGLITVADPTNPDPNGFIFDQSINYLEFSLVADEINQVHFPTQWGSHTPGGFTIWGYNIITGQTIQLQQNSPYKDLGTITVKNQMGTAVAVISAMFSPGTDIVPVQITLASGYKLYHSIDFTPKKTMCGNGLLVAPGTHRLINSSDNNSNETNEFNETSIGYNTDATTAPNPFNDAFKLQFDLETAADCHAAIYDACGRLITDVIQHEQLPAGQYEYRVETARWTPGLYFLRFQNGTDSKVIKLLKE
jgi:hypothetical protein